MAIDALHETGLLKQAMSATYIIGTHEFRLMKYHLDGEVFWQEVEGYKTRIKIIPGRKRWVEKVFKVNNQQLIKES